MSSDIDAARTEVTRKERDRDTLRARLAGDVEKQQVKIRELTTGRSALVADNAVLSEQLAESHRDVAELRTWHHDLEVKREKRKSEL